MKKTKPGIRLIQALNSCPRLYECADRQAAIRLLESLDAVSLGRLLPQTDDWCEQAASSRVFVIDRGKELSGIALLWRKSFHPHCVYIDLKVAKQEPDDTAGKELMRILLAEAGNEALQTSFMSGQRLSEDFYARYGFVQVRRTYMSLLRLDSVIDNKSDREGAVAKKSNEPEELLSIVTFEKLVEDSRMIESLAALMRDTYGFSHSVNPPGDFDLSVWRRFAEAEDVLTEGSFAAICCRRRQVMAFAVLHGEVGEAEAELGWTGCREKFGAWMEETQRRRMIFCSERGFMQVSAEIDDTDPYQFPLLDRYPFDVPPPLLTYRKEKDNAGSGLFDPSANQISSIGPCMSGSARKENIRS